MFATFDPQLVGLLGTALSALIAALGYKGKLRHERLRTTRVVLYYLLEMHHRVQKLQKLITVFPRQATVTLRSALAAQSLTVTDTQLEQIHAAVDPGFRQFVERQMDELRLEVLEPYRKALLDLAKDDPMLAYSLKGQEELHATASNVEAMLKDAMSKEGDASGNALETFHRVLGDYARHAVVEDLAKSTKLAARKCGLWIFLLTVRRIRQDRRRELPESVGNEMGGFIKKINDQSIVQQRGKTTEPSR